MSARYLFEFDIYFVFMQFYNIFNFLELDYYLKARKLHYYIHILVDKPGLPYIFSLKLIFLIFKATESLSWQT